MNTARIILTRHEDLRIKKADIIAQMKARGTDNIFFDISDEFRIVSAPPSFLGSTVGGSVDEQYTFAASFEEAVTDACVIPMI